MIILAKRTVLQPGKELEYEDMHRDPPTEVCEALVAAGVTQWRIWRSGLDLFHVLETSDVTLMRARLAADPVIQKWNARIRTEFLQELPTDYAGDLTAIWQLAPPQPE